MSSAGPTPGPQSEDPDRRKRAAFRILGVLLLLVAVALLLVALVDFFGAMSSDDFDAAPTKFWMAFVGLPLLAVSGWLLQAGYARSLTSYYAEETAPAMRTTGEAFGLRRRDGSGRFCSHCGRPAETGARFCSACGTALA